MATKGLSGRKEMCLKHPDRPAVSRCASCHAPVCKECAVKKGGSIFCSDDCAQAAKSFHEQYKGPAKLSKNYVHRFVQVVVYLAVLLGILWVLAGPLNMGFAKKLINLVPGITMP